MAAASSSSSSSATPPASLPVVVSSMPMARLGNTGLKVSRICLGCMTYGSPKWQPWVLDESASLPFIKRALELGINFFDTADIYSNGISEQILGNAFRKLGVRRDDVVIATKCYFPMSKGPNGRGLSRKHIIEACDASLERLQTSYIDLYQIHRWDSETPIEETMEALHDLVKAGKVRYIGASSMYAWQFAKANAIAKARGWTPFVSMQNHYNLIYREEEREMNAYCVSEGIALLPWAPLAGGFLAGNRTPTDDVKRTPTPAAFTTRTAASSSSSSSTATGTPAAPAPAAPLTPAATTRAATDRMSRGLYNQPDDFVIVERVRTVATRLNRPPAQVALAWLLKRAGVVAPIIGASKLAQLEDAVSALSVTLSAADMKYLEEAYKPHRILGHL